jgi:nucleoside-diphosphate-sugar epimerase
MSHYSLFAEDLDHILDHTRDAWEELRGQRIFITGGTGFFGMWLVESFLWANQRLHLGARAVVLSRNPPAFCQKQPHLAEFAALSFHQGDVRDFAFPPGTFSHVIHAATQSSARLNEQSPAVMLDTIVAGTERTLDFAVACRAKKFLLTSSGAVYGLQPPEMIHVAEDYPSSPNPTAPSSAYGEGKRMAELQCTIYHRQHGLDALIARCFAFVGPYLPLDAHFAVGNFIRDALAGGPIFVNGDGTPYRSYLYAADLAVWLWTILFGGRPCRPYNVGAEQSVSIAELAHIVAHIFQNRMAVKIARPAEPGASAQRYVPSTRRARAELGLDADVGLKDAVHRTAQWYLQGASFPCRLQSAT